MLSLVGCTLKGRGVSCPSLRPQCLEQKLSARKEPPWPLLPSVMSPVAEQVCVTWAPGCRRLHCSAGASCGERARAGCRGESLPPRVSPGPGLQGAFPVTGGPDGRACGPSGSLLPPLRVHVSRRPDHASSSPCPAADPQGARCTGLRWACGVLRRGAGSEGLPGPRAPSHGPCGGGRPGCGLAEEAALWWMRAGSGLVGTWAGAASGSDACRVVAQVAWGRRGLSGQCPGQSQVPDGSVLGQSWDRAL